MTALMDGEPERGIKEHLLEVAERLFAEGGIAETSVRDITTTAGVNVAAVNYHFGSKEALLREIVARRLAALNDECLRRLEMCPAAPKPTVEALLSALAGPSIVLCFSHPYFALLASRLRLDVDRTHWREYRAQRRGVMQRFRAAFAAVLPELSENEVATRLHYINGSIQHLWSHSPMDTSKTAETVLRSFLTFYAAALRAPGPPEH